MARSSWKRSKRKREALEIEVTATADIDEIFFAEQEEITDEVIAEMVKKGMPRGDLERMAAEGYLYCRKRDSFMSPLEFGE